MKVEQASFETMEAFFQSLDKFVLTFVGYSNSGYQDRAAMLAIAQHELGMHDPTRTVVNSGAVPVGIGQVYPLAKQAGFATTGILSTMAKTPLLPLAPCVDTVFYVEDTTWGGFVEGTQRLSPTSIAMVEFSDRVVAIGGGAVARDELLAARAAGKPVKYFAADLNHSRAIELARKNGLPRPSDFRGAAADASWPGDI